jgi:hypothetical protein
MLELMVQSRTVARMKASALSDFLTFSDLTAGIVLLWLTSL